MKWSKGKVGEKSGKKGLTQAGKENVSKMRSFVLEASERSCKATTMKELLDVTIWRSLMTLTNPPWW